MVGELVDIHNTVVQLRLRYLEAASDKKLLQEKNESIQARMAAQEHKCEEGRFLFFSSPFPLSPPPPFSLFIPLFL